MNLSNGIFNEYDVVRATRELEKVPNGTRGNVVMVYGEGGHSK